MVWLWVAILVCVCVLHEALGGLLLATSLLLMQLEP